MKAYIYKITNKINSKSYIGQTVQQVKRRFSSHKSPRSFCKILKSAIDKYGFENFEVYTLIEIERETKEEIKEELNTLEIQAIKDHGTLVPNGYNITAGGGGTLGKKYAPGTFHGIGRKASEETKAKIAKANTGLKRPWMKDHAAKMTKMRQKPIKCNETGQTWPSIKECAESFGVKPEAVHRHLRGLRKRFRKLTFSYLTSNLYVDTH